MRQALAELAVEAERWEEACQLAADHPDLAETVCLPWAEWLLPEVASRRHALPTGTVHPQSLACCCCCCC